MVFLHLLFLRALELSFGASALSFLCLAACQFHYTIMLYADQHLAGN